MNPKDRAGAAKPNLSILPFAPLFEAVAAIYEGRRKYGAWNWRNEKVSDTIYADAAIRHLMQFIAGEDIDPESGVHHISKAIAGLLVIRDAQIHGTNQDDRLVEQNLNISAVMEQLAAVTEKYPDPATSDSESEPESEPESELEKWSDTVAGGGSYLITAEDVGKRVELADGKEYVICDWYTHTGWPVRYGNDIFRSSTTSYGQASCDVRDEDGFQHMETDAGDIVRVYHS
ncbi:MAG: hypothetical protein GY906_04725 [bacterium]|nr:hypothetical protein [bacterium]